MTSENSNNVTGGNCSFSLYPTLPRALLNQSSHFHLGMFRDDLVVSRIFYHEVHVL